jgi:hypothetical protein
MHVLDPLVGQKGREMSSQTGECQIDAIEGTVVRGWFKSVYEKNVHTANTSWAAMFLKDAFESLSGLKRDEGELYKAIKGVTFETPNAASTKVVIEVSDAAVLSGLEEGYWESYYVG